MCKIENRYKLIWGILNEDFEQLFKDNYRSLVSYLSVLCGSLEIAEDVAQDAFLKAMLNIDTFKGKSSFKTWLFAIARNVLYEYFRKSRTLSFDELDEMTLAQVTKSNDTEVQAMRSVLAQEVMSKISTLKEPLRTVLLARIVEEKTFQEIAQEIGKTEGACRVIFTRAKKRLREMYYGGE